MTATPTVTATATSTVTPGSPPSAVRRRRLRLGDAIIPVFTAVAFVYLLVPIGYTVAFSFNDYFKSNIVWNGFTWDNWANPCGAPRVCESFSTSLQVGAVATIAATALGTLLAVGLVRFRFGGRSAVNLLVFLPMSTPEIVLGSALAAQFLLVRATYGFWTIVAAHVMFCISFVVVTVKARVASLDPALEEAAADLYASPLAAFWRVTFPLLLPGIGAAALLSFSLSFDDYIVTNLNAGSVKTFPMFVYTSHQKGIPAQANVLATIMFLLALVAVLVTQVWAVQRRRRQEAAHARRAVADRPPVSRPGRVPARPSTLVRPRLGGQQPKVAAAPTLQAEVSGLSVQGHRPFSVATVAFAGVVGGALAFLTALVRVSNAYDADLRRWLVILGVALVMTPVSGLLLRGTAWGRTVYAVVVGCGIVGLLLALTVFSAGKSLGLVVVLVAAVACLLLVFTKAANEYFRPPGGRSS